MPRLPRLFMPGQAHHVILRGNNKQAIFFEDSDRALFLDYLGDGLAAEGCALFAYVLMTNHVHLLLSAEAETAIPRLMQSLGRRYVGYVNRAYGRTGTLWEGRYKSTIVDSETYVLACHRYIEANPLRARMVRRPEDHLWSSYRAHALGRADRLLTEHPTYTALGITRHARQAEYRALFELGLDEAMLATLRDATNQGWIPGSDRFRRQIAVALGRRVTPPRRGRPPKERPAAREEGEGRLI
jgi:putative transposase